MFDWFKKKKRPPRNYTHQVGPWMFDFETMHAKMHPQYAIDSMVSEAYIVWSQDNIRILEITSERRLVGEFNFFKDSDAQEEINKQYRRWERKKIDAAFEQEVLDGPTCG